MLMASNAWGADQEFQDLTDKILDRIQGDSTDSMTVEKDYDDLESDRKWLSCKADFDLEKKPNPGIKEYIFGINVETEDYIYTDFESLEMEIGYIWVDDSSLTLLGLGGNLDRETLVLSITNPLAKHLSHLGNFIYKCEIVSYLEALSRGTTLISEAQNLKDEQWKQQKKKNKI